MIGSLVDVLFEVPTEVVKGIASGEMIRRGGVVQWASGPDKGQVVAWLREAGALARGTNAVPALVVEQLQSLQMATQSLAIGQAVTLGFSVLSFAVVTHKLNVLEQKIDGACAAIAALREDVAWLDRRQDVALAARLRGAIDQAAWAHDGGRLEALVPIRGVLAEVEHHCRGLLEGMLETQRAHVHADLFAAYHGYFALSAIGRTRCEVMLDGADAGVRSLVRTRAALGEIGLAYREPLKHLDEHPHLLRLGVGADRTLRPALETMRETAARVEGYESELEFCARESVPLSDWEQVGGAEADGRLILLLPSVSNRTDVTSALAADHSGGASGPSSPR